MDPASAVNRHRLANLPENAPGNMLSMLIPTNVSFLRLH